MKEKRKFYTCGIDIHGLLYLSNQNYWISFYLGELYPSDECSQKNKYSEN